MSEEKPMTTKDRIKQVRQKLELTQGEFAKRISILTSYLAGMESGDKKINDRVIRLIGMEYNVSEHWLRTGEGEMHDKKSEPNLVKLTSLFKLLRPSFQECAIAQLDALVALDKSETPE